MILFILTYNVVIQLILPNSLSWISNALDWIPLTISLVSLYLSYSQHKKQNQRFKFESNYCVETISDSIHVKSRDGSYAPKNSKTASPIMNSFFLLDIAITNSSEIPFTIKRFELRIPGKDEVYTFGAHDSTLDYFSVTTEYGKAVFGAIDNHLEYIDPYTVAKPYSVVYGHVLFWYGNSTDITIEKDVVLNLNIITSRGNISFDFKIEVTYETDIENQHKNPEPVYFKNDNNH